MSTLRTFFVAAAVAVVANAAAVAFSIDAPIALVADDPFAAAGLHEALRPRFANVVVYEGLAAAKEAASLGDEGPEIALVVSSSQDRATNEAYGTSLSSCHVMLNVQVLELPAGKLEFSRSSDGKAPDCNAARLRAQEVLADELVKGLETYRRHGASPEKEFLWVELADAWTAGDLSLLHSSLLEIPGVRSVVPGPEGRVLKLEVYREPRALAREIDALGAVKLARLTGRRATVVHADGVPAGRAELPNPTPSPAKDAVADTTLVSESPARHIPQARGRKWALVVGISQFRDPSIPTLSFPIRDAEAFATVLQDSGVGRFAPDDVVLLMNDQATTRGIKTALNDFARKTHPDDLFLFYFSSHAVPGEYDAAGDAYLITHDTEKKNLYGTGLPMRELVDALQARIRAQTVVAFLDACNTGQVVNRSDPVFQGAKALVHDRSIPDRQPAAPSASTFSWSREWTALSEPAAPPAPPSTRRAVDVPRPAAVLQEPQEPVKRVVFISSSDGDQPSWESEELGHGFFTYYLMDILRRSGGRATVQSIFEYLRSEVKRAVQLEKGAIQEPRMFFNLDAEILVGYQPDN